MADSERSRLRKALTERHISMIAFSATVGFGITIRSGTVLNLLGPGGAIIAFSLASALAWGSLGPFVEMTSSVDFTGPIWELPAQYLDKTIGASIGYIFLLTYLSVFADEIAMFTRLIKFHYNEDVSWGISSTAPAIWALVAWITSSAVNFLPVKLYGDMEYAFGLVKLIGLTLLIIAQIPVNLAGKYDPDSTSYKLWGDPIGFRYWYNCADSNCYGSTGFFRSVFRLGNPREDAYFEITSPNTARFLGLWTAWKFTAFSILGSASICISAAEAKRRTQDLKWANRKTLLRLISLYLFGNLLVSFNVPYDHENLFVFESEGHTTSNSSPFMIAIVEAGPTFYPLAHFANGLLVFFVWSCATSNLYVASRTLYSLALKNHVPEFARDSIISVSVVDGVPYNAIFICAMFGALGFLGTGEKAQSALDALSRIGTMCWLITFLFLTATYLIYFYTIEKHLKNLRDADDPTRPQVDRNFRPLQEPNPDRRIPVKIYPYRTWGQPQRSYINLVVIFLMTIFGGWHVFAGAGYRFNAESFIGAYFALFLFLGIWSFAKFLQLKTVNFNFGRMKLLESKESDHPGGMALDRYKSADAFIELLPTGRARAQLLARNIGWWFDFYDWDKQDKPIIYRRAVLQDDESTIAAEGEKVSVYGPESGAETKFQEADSKKGPNNRVEEFYGARRDETESDQIQPVQGDS